MNVDYPNISESIDLLLMPDVQFNRRRPGFRDLSRRRVAAPCNLDVLRANDVNLHSTGWVLFTPQRVRCNAELSLELNLR
jgi:hypothetical protein